MQTIDATEIRHQHQQLAATLEAVHEVLACIESDGRLTRPATAGWLLLQSLRDRLADHFALEEDGGYFAQASAEAPHLTRGIEELQLDHRDLSTRAEQLADLAVAARDDAPLWKRAREDFDQLRQLLLDHEQREDDLIFQLHQVDLGGG